MTQWERTRLPMQGTQVRFLVWEDSTCLEQLRLDATTTEPALQSLSSATREATTMRGPGTTAREWSPVTTTRERPCTATKIQCNQK